VATAPGPPKQGLPAVSSSTGPNLGGLRPLLRLNGPGCGRIAGSGWRGDTALTYISLVTGELVLEDLR
jgi:hypothetical protein